MQSMLMHALNAPWLAVFSVRLLVAVSAIWLCAGVASIMLRSFSAALKHRIWAMSTAAVLLTPILLLVMPEWRTGIIKAERVEPVITAFALPAAATVVGPQREMAQIEPPDRGMNRAQRQTSVESEPMTHLPPSGRSAAVQAQSAPHNPSPTAPKPGFRSSLIFIAWLVPAMLLIARMLLARIAVWRWLRRSSLPSPQWQAALAKLCEKHSTRQPRLCVSDQTLTPVCLGIVRSAIVIPASALDWDEARVQAVLTHELSHVVRRDVLWQTLAQLACAIYWFHPLSWMAQWRMRIEREIACDDSVVSASQPATSYARSLLDLATSFGKAPAPRGITTAGVAMANSANLEHRVKAILDADRRRSPVSRRVGIAIAVVAIATLALFSTLSPFAAHRAKAAEAPKSYKQPTTVPADVPAGKYRLFGKVTDESGKPMADIALTILTGPHPAAKLRSGADGSFEFSRDSLPFNYDIVLASSADGKLLAFAPAAQAEDERGKPSHEVKVVLKPAREFGVSVHDKTGAGVAGAWVGACSAYKTVAHVITDAEGNGTLLVPADAPLMHVIAMKDGVGFDYHLFWRKDERRTDPYRLEPDFKGPFSFTLNGVKPVTVSIVDDDGKPLPGVKIDPWLYLKPAKGSEINLSGLEELQKTSDARGKATFDVPVDLVRGTNFWTRLDGYCAPERAIYDPKKPVTDIRVQMLKLIALHGYVRDTDGNPVASAKVHINGVGYHMDDFRTDVTTDSVGAFAAEVNPELYYGFGADKDVRAAQMRFSIVHRKAPEPIELKLEKTMAVRLTVTSGPENAPAANASIAFYQREDGSYYKLPKEQQFPGESVGRRWMSPMIVQSLKTDADGMVTVHAPVPGNLSLYAYVNGQQPAVHFKIKDWQTYTLVEQTGPGRRQEKRFDIASPERGIALELHTDSAAVANRMLKGHVVMRDNPTMSVPDIKVSFRSVGDLFPRDDSVSNKAGDFIIRQDKALQYLFGTSLDGKLRGIAIAKPENTSVTLMVGPTASMHGRLVDPDGHPLGGKTIEWGFEVKHLFGTFSTNFGSNAVTDSNGLFHFDGVVPGYEYKLSVVTKFGDHGEPMGWRPVATKTAPTAEDVDLGDVTLPADREYKPKTPDDYATESFGKPGTITGRLKNAQEIARLSYQQVLVVLGSADRQAAKRFFEFRHDRENSDAWAALADYALVSANVDDRKNGAQVWASQFNIDCRFPRVAFVILHMDGHYVTHASDLELSSGDQLSRSKLIAFARQHTLAKPDARQILAGGLARAKARDKRVLVEESGPYCSWCVKLGQYFEAHREQLVKDYVIVTLDYRFAHGEEVISRLKSTEGGIPWMAILDENGKTLITSDDPKIGNIGYPGEPGGRLHWERMLRATSRHMTAGDIQALLDSLK
jgi:beta-lactamase regulating signal transducer with metallopeptidase domain